MNVGPSLFWIRILGRDVSIPIFFQALLNYVTLREFSSSDTCEFYSTPPSHSSHLTNSVHNSCRVRIAFYIDLKGIPPFKPLDISSAIYPPVCFQSYLLPLSLSACSIYLYSSHQTLLLPPINWILSKNICLKSQSSY